MLYTLIWTVFFFISSHSHANVCKSLLGTQTQTSSVRSMYALDSFDDLKRHPFWSHENPNFQDNLVSSFVEQTQEESGKTLHKILIELTESNKISLLKRAQRILEQTDQEQQNSLQDFKKVSESLNKRYDIILDLGFDEGPRLRRFALGEQILIKDKDSLEKAIQKAYRERESLFELFGAVAQTADESIKTYRFVDSSTLDIKPFPEEITLLAYTLRHHYPDLFRMLATSPQVKRRLHLDYSVLLLDELERLPYEDRTSYRSLVMETFSPSALSEYRSGKRGADGTTVWDKIPLGAY